MNAQVTVDKNFRRFMVEDDIGQVAEGIQFQDGRASTREVEGPGKTVTDWDAVEDIRRNPHWGSSMTVRWVDEDDDVIISSQFRRFVLQRDKDETGVSGPGQVVEGVQFDDGRVAVRWCAGELRSYGDWDQIPDMIGIHGHDGATRVVWVD